MNKLRNVLILFVIVEFVMFILFTGTLNINTVSQFNNVNPFQMVKYEKQ